jgi:hypothetical protein
MKNKNGFKIIENECEKIVSKIDFSTLENKKVFFYFPDVGRYLDATIYRIKCGIETGRNNNTFVILTKN